MVPITATIPKPIKIATVIANQNFQSKRCFKIDLK